MLTLMYGDQLVKCNVFHREQLSGKILIHVRPNGKVEVEAPKCATNTTIKTALQKRARWIFKHIAAADDAKSFVIPRSYVSGETHFYLGRRYQLKIVEDKKQPSSVKLIGGRIQVILPVSDTAAIKRRLNEWYSIKANDYFTRRIIDFSSQLSWIKNTPSVKLVNMRKQWGSCSPAGSININPALIRAARHCIDYVLLHELCHLKEHNHSPKFYSLLASNCPDWKNTKTELDGIAELLLVG